MNEIKVKYIYSACVLVETKDIKLLCGPWFTEGVFDGAWYQYPPIQDPLSLIGDVDAIYISHIHPDHYAPVFLRSDYYFCILLPDDNWCVLNASCENFFCKFLENGAELFEPKSEFYLDPRYLFGLLTHIYHWNNAEVGSHIKVRRHPNIVDRTAQSFLNFFCVG